MRIFNEVTLARAERRRQGAARYRAAFPNAIRDDDVLLFPNCAQGFGMLAWIERDVRDGRWRDAPRGLFGEAVDDGPSLLGDEDE
jgi:hypothetical protein